MKELPFCGLVGAGEGRVAGLVVEAPTESRRGLFCFVFYSEKTPPASPERFFCFFKKGSLVSIVT